MSNSIITSINRVNFAKGFRILILDLNDVSQESLDKLHSCGGQIDYLSKEFYCPNCNKSLFPIFKLNFNDPRLIELDLWDNSILQVIICPACDLYMKPYWVCFTVDGIELIGGARSKEVLIDVRTPYETRNIQLIDLTDQDCPLDGEERNDFLSRKMFPGVYHQVGGQPIFEANKTLNCIKCEKEMKFAGIIDYDDWNVPLFEKIGERDYEKVALVIGDNDRIYYYTCKGCNVIGMQWVH